MSSERVDEDYWAGVWAESPEPVTGGIDDSSIRRLPRRLLAAAIRDAMPPEAVTLLEVGAARSTWLPWFATELGLRVTGLDYTANGCAQAVAVLEAAGVDGRVVEADLFDPPDDLLSASDVVFSNGLVEHFDDTAECVRSLAALARPGGRLLTLIPNLCGVLGSVQKRLDRAVYDIHVPLDADSLAAAHRAAGLTVRATTYLVPVNVGVLNLNRTPAGTPGWYAKKGLLWGGSRVVWAFWSLERFRTLPAGGRRLSSYVLCVADRP